MYEKLEKGSKWVLGNWQMVLGASAHPLERIKDQPGHYVELHTSWISDSFELGDHSAATVPGDLVGTDDLKL